MLLRVVLDTNVLYPRYLRQSLLRISDLLKGSRSSKTNERLYLPFWSAGILEELHRNLRKSGITESAVSHIIAVMQQDHPDAEVRGYQHLVESMTCDPGDRHVLAAAVHAGADAIVTRNIRDFPSASVDPYGVSVIHPDDFLLELFSKHAEAIIVELELLADTARRNEPASLSELVAALRLAGAPEFAAELEGYDG